MNTSENTEKLLKKNAELNSAFFLAYKTELD